MGACPVWMPLTSSNISTQGSTSVDTEQREEHKTEVIMSKQVLPCQGIPQCHLEPRSLPLHELPFAPRSPGGKPVLELPGSRPLSCPASHTGFPRVPTGSILSRALGAAGASSSAAFSFKSMVHNRIFI